MIAERLREVRERIDAACAANGRSSGDVQIIAVTKSHGIEIVEAARAAGLRHLGENRVQEAAAKYGAESGRTPVPGEELHLIGHLQSNKCKMVPGLFQWVDSIDSWTTAHELSRRLVAAGKSCRLLLQYNSSGEEAKSGYRDATLLLEDAARIAELPHVELRGVMTIGPLGAAARDVAHAFEHTRELFERLAVQEPRIDVLSMGMSGDFEIAIAHGSTEVRIGSALFGARS